MNLRHIRRAGTCGNCDRELDPVSDNFCPNCGQLNNTRKETAFGLVKELIEEFLHLDSKVTGSLGPLLFSPGKLTVDYNSGKRQRYFHPVRLFLTVTIIFFLIQSSFNHGKEKIKSSKLHTSFIYDDEKGYIPDTIDGVNSNIYWDFGGNKTISDDSLNMYVDRFKGNTDLMMDTLHLKKTFITKIIFSQIIKAKHDGFAKVSDYFKHKLPWIIFTLMPVFAFMLALFYYRKKFYFVDHLIFAFHLHTATFVILTVWLLINHLFNIDNDLLLLLIPLYYFMALKKVYNQRWGKTILKGILIGAGYVVSGFIVMIGVGLLLFVMY